MKSAHRILLVGLVGIVLALGQAAPSQADVSSVPTSGYPGFNLTVRVIVHQGNTVYVGGDFTRVTDANGTHDRNHVAAFESSDLHCTPIEVDILAQLVKYPGQALSHAFLTEKVWGYKNVADATLLKGHISSIRKKIRDAGGSEDLVRTVHGVGYSFTPV